MKLVPNPFLHCPACSTANPSFIQGHEIRCPTCGFRYFHNIAAACGAIIIHKERILFIVRGHEPAKGTLGLPGGFVDPGESLEVALAREVKEEVGGTIGPVQFVASFPNQYLFAGITYNTCDTYFKANLISPPEALVPAAGEISQLRWLLPQEIEPAAFGFPSLVALWEKTNGFRLE